jgi:hypothetical protein
MNEYLSSELKGVSGCANTAKHSKTSKFKKSVKATHVITPEFYNRYVKGTSMQSDQLIPGRKICSSCYGNFSCGTSTKPVRQGTKRNRENSSSSEEASTVDDFLPDVVDLTLFNDLMSKVGLEPVNRGKLNQKALVSTLASRIKGLTDLAISLAARCGVVVELKFADVSNSNKSTYAGMSKVIPLL